MAKSYSFTTGTKFSGAGYKGNKVKAPKDPTLLPKRTIDPRKAAEKGGPSVIVSP